ncbi:MULTISPECIES: fatty acid oxidation complex subunit alpha FadJ [Ferrimonas]|uniref:fatty acid oxidation complex subunit alpha FadJ n=1 Tax=Ferrimonas TaxID=44011 RepID=UPI000407072A|nr:MULTISPECIES: fatty acid oxidation complex subunit alpha FadJ [Ferrimonas]USD36676.1 fatty acid oxidation complex subunit alpha FadJ [Ferrimonas sp. SCSIO 43195]
MKTDSFQVEVGNDKIAVITMDVPGETMNTLRSEFGEEVRQVLDFIKSRSDLLGIVFTSGKPDSFIAGADINMLADCQTAEDVYTLSRDGHKLLNELSRLPLPVVAAIHGPCLGGGLELALACDYRVISNHAKTVLGLPEVQLGILPGGGGTQRLPKLVGIAKSLDMMLTGKQLRAKQAVKLGVADEMVPNTVLLSAAKKWIGKGKRKAAKPKLKGVEKLLEATPVGRNVIFDQALKTVMAKTQGNYPAPAKIIECVKASTKDLESGLKLEARHFADLVMSPESAALRSIFFATTEMKKETGAGDVKPEKIERAMVLGGGLMGGGIANVTAIKAKVPVRIKDISHQGISMALGSTWKQLDKKVKRRHITEAERDKAMAMMTGTTDYQGIKDVDIVVEAVFEDLGLKHQMVKDVEAHCSDSTIFATNTSSLPIGQIAQAAQRPENVIGLHYFSPVEKMPLAEVIAHKSTSAQTIATTVAFAKKQGKTPIVVQDCAGFYVNRILAPYMNEAATLVLEGEPIEKLDKALVKFGFPVGPVTLLDEVGIDVGAKISPILEAELGSRFAAPPAFAKLLADDRKGRKNGKGFYQFNGKKKGPKPVDESVYKVLGITPQGRLSDSEMSERCVVHMLNEAVRCLDEGIIASARDGDIGAIFGIGFPPFLGGPFRYIDSLGQKRLVEILQGYQSKFGDRFAPSEYLVKMAEEGRHFYD